MGLVKRIEQVSAAFDEQGTMRTEPVKISLKDNVVPYVVHTARRVPIPLLPKVKAELKRMEESGVIKKITYPTDWCAPMVPVMKPNRKVRICIDLKKPNENIKRERYMLPHDR